MSASAFPWEHRNTVQTSTERLSRDQLWGAAQGASGGRTLRLGGRRELRLHLFPEEFHRFPVRAAFQEVHREGVQGGEERVHGVLDKVRIPAVNGNLWKKAGEGLPPG